MPDLARFSRSSGNSFQTDITFLGRFRDMQTNDLTSGGTLRAD